MYSFKEKLKALFINKGWYDFYKGYQIIKKEFFNINHLKTCYVNLRYFPLKQAVMMPILIGRNVRLRSLGNLCIEGKIVPAMISIGVLKVDLWEDQRQSTIFSNLGTIRIQGKIKIHPGARIVVKKNAELTFKGLNTIGAQTKVICYKRISIGSNSGCSWNCQIFDTDFHFLYDLINERPLKRTVPIIIGNNVFIGNHCNIAKGTKIPHGTVISSWSKVAGSFMREGENILIAGNPAKVIDRNYTMTHAWDTEKEKAYSELLES